MKVGDLVKYKSGAFGLVNFIGVVVKDGTFMCSHGVDTAYRTGTVHVFWINGYTEQECFVDLEVINESR